MEIIIALLVLGFALWWAFLRSAKKPEVSAPYKVETPKVVEANVELAPQVATATVVVEEAVVPEALVEAPAKKPRKPRAPKAEKPAAKKAAPKKAAARTAKPKAKSKKV